MSQKFTERQLCLNFVNNPNVHPDNPSKSMREGKGPFNNYMLMCEDNGIDTSGVRQKLNSTVRARSPVRTRSPVRIPARSPARSKSPVRTRSKSPVEPSIYRHRSVFAKPLTPDDNLIIPSKLRPQKLKSDLLSNIYLTVDDFNSIKRKPYEEFLKDVVNITNNNGGNIDFSVFDETLQRDIIVNVPKRYTTKQSGNKTFSFHDDKGINFGRLLYHLAPTITSKFPEYQYFHGLKRDASTSNIYTLLISDDSW